MSTYCDANGQLNPAGQYQRVGDRILLREGTWLGFDVALCDSAPAGKDQVFFKDTAAADAAVRVEVARTHAEHYKKFAFLGDRAPAFNAGAAEAIARANVVHADATAVRNAARAAVNMPRSCAPFAPGNAPLTPGTFATSEQVRDAARRARYR